MNFRIKSKKKDKVWFYPGFLELQKKYVEKFNLISEFFHIDPFAVFAEVRKNIIGDLR